MGLFSKNTKDETVVKNSDLPHNTNDAPELIEASNDESNNPTVQGEDHNDKSLDRKKSETQQAYNERVPVALQPVLPGATKSYLGEDL